MSIFKNDKTSGAAGSVNAKNLSLNHTMLALCLALLHRKGGAL